MELRWAFRKTPKGEEGADRGCMHALLFLSYLPFPAWNVDIMASTPAAILGVLGLNCVLTTVMQKARRNLHD